MFLMPQATPSTDSISFRCPTCQARLRAQRILLGRPCPCPRCRQQVIVQVPIPSDADILLVSDEK
jgi:DNA-directed RNA polymerase subunit RPC12/RpoP